MTVLNHQAGHVLLALKPSKAPSTRVRSCPRLRSHCLQCWPRRQPFASLFPAFLPYVTVFLWLSWPHGDFLHGVPLSGMFSLPLIHSATSYWSIILFLWPPSLETCSQYVPAGMTMTLSLICLVSPVNTTFGIANDLHFTCKTWDISLHSCTLLRVAIESCSFFDPMARN